MHAQTMCTRPLLGGDEAILTFDQKVDGCEGLGTRLVKPTANKTEPCSQVPPLPTLPGPSHSFCSTTVWLKWERLGNEAFMG